MEVFMENKINVVTDKDVNLIDLLLDKERKDFLEKYEDIEISSLSNMLGHKFVVQMKRLSLSKEAELEDYNYKIKMSEKGRMELGENLRRKKLLTIVYSIFYNGKELFKNKELIEKFGAATPEDLVLILLTPDEIETLYEEYDNLINNIPSDIEIKN